MCVCVCVCLYVVHATLLWEYLGGVELTTPNTRVGVEAYFPLGKNEQFEKQQTKHVCFNVFLPLNKKYSNIWIVILLKFEQSYKAFFALRNPRESRDTF